jgi:hypothetical protein
VFVAYIAIAVPLILFYLESFRWFVRDEWSFFSGRKVGSLDDLFRPTNGHWTTLPVLAFRFMWALVGLRSYVPYQLMAVTLHLAVAVLLRYVMRRAGVRPWLATIAAGSFVLFGPGEQNIGEAFQISLVGSLAFGLVALILVDHDGRVGWRDYAAIGAGIAALMCSGVGTTMAMVVVIAAFTRRGWKPAALQAGPLGVTYLVYALAEHPDVSPVGRPSLGLWVRWVWHSMVGTLEAIGHFTVIAIALFVVLVAGSVLFVRSTNRDEVRRRGAVPAAMVAGSVLFAASTGFGRWWSGLDQASASRYVYLGAAFVLPALALAMETIARYWRPTVRRSVIVGALMALLVIPIPWNIANFETNSIRQVFASQRNKLEAAPRMPFAASVPRNVVPVHHPQLSEGVTIGFLLDAARAGKLPAPSSIPERQVNEMKVRLGVAQFDDDVQPTRCAVHNKPIDSQPSKGSVYHITEPVMVATLDNGQLTSPQISFDPANGKSLTIELSGLSLRISPVPGAKSFALCH